MAIRLTERRIRQIIHEELGSLHEMPYAGNLGSRPGNPASQEDSDMKRDPRAAEKFALSGRFKSLAEKHLSHIPFPVWVAPLLGLSDDTPYDRIASESFDERLAIFPLFPTGINKLTALGYQIPEEINKSDAVILYSTNGVDLPHGNPQRANTTQMATPWMIFHAMFDSLEYHLLSPLLGDIILNLGEERVDDDTPYPELDPLESDFPAEWVGALTMKSARESDLPFSDAFAEIMCQELLTSKGFHIDEHADIDPEQMEALRALKPYIKQCADEVRRAIKGKLVIVSVN